MIPVLFFTFVAGIATGWCARPFVPAALTRVEPVDAQRPETGTGGDERVYAPPTDSRPAASPGTQSEHKASAGSPNETAESAQSDAHLRLPIDEADIDAMKGQFGEQRDRGARGHEAVDILAPRNTPVHAVDDGKVVKLFFSKRGGITIYQFDPSGRFCYYYAHLARYATGLREGQTITRGEVIGYVGTTGNAPANTPHLHFAIFKLTPEQRWWEGTPIDPWPAFGR